MALKNMFCPNCNRRVGAKNGGMVQIIIGIIMIVVGLPLLILGATTVDAFGIIGIMYLVFGIILLASGIGLLLLYFLKTRYIMICSICSSRIDAREHNVSNIDK